MLAYKCSGLTAVVPIPPEMVSTSVGIKEAHGNMKRFPIKREPFLLKA
jgi:hypothetical protein